MQKYTDHSKPIYSFQKANQPISEGHVTNNIPLHTHIEQALNTYLVASKGQSVTGLYDTLLTAIEPPLLKVALAFCKTQNEAAKTLGLSRGTLRKKLKQYHLLND
tara:strand:- start:120 stop:434 length:315 start_codon:yes stop_codon:yes gene_type:complete